MIENQFALLLFLIIVVAVVLYFSERKQTAPFFKYLPTPLWCYFIPTLAATAGLIPSNSALYKQMSQLLLPSSLFLLLLGTDMNAIYRLSRKSTIAMLGGSVGIFFGGTVCFFLFLRLTGNQNDALTAEVWKGWGCLAASWTGGSANMVAVKEILNAPELLFSNLIIVDTVVAYSWMAFLIFLSKYQVSLDRHLEIEQNSEPKETAELEMDSLPDRAQNVMPSSKLARLSIFLALALVFGRTCWIVSGWLPEIGTVLNRMGWNVILATAVPLILSATAAAGVGSATAGKTGSFMLFLLLTSIGARANLKDLGAAPLFIPLGILWVALHGFFLLILGRIFKIPISLLASASQANVGGPISAPIVASVYGKNLAPIAIVMAVLGNIYGTYAGLLFSEICRRLRDLL